MFIESGYYQMLSALNRSAHCTKYSTNFLQLFSSKMLICARNSGSYFLDS